MVTSYDHSDYTNQVSIEGKATAQKSSGRCWIFACLNVIRVEMMKKYDLPEFFELSQTYVFFWDKLERANFFLESMIQTRGEPLDGRLMTHLLSNTNLMSDGGQWDMLANLITKYGLVRVVFSIVSIEHTHSKHITGTQEQIPGSSRCDLVKTDESFSSREVEKVRMRASCLQDG